MKNFIKYVSLAVTVCCMASLAGCYVRDTNKRITVVSSGASEYRIVIPANSGTTYEKAACELRKYIAAISGATLAIVTDAEAAVENEILIGKTNRGDFDVDYEELSEDGYFLKVSGKKIIIAGGLRGCIYGVYGFLRLLGVGFYSFDCEYVPTSDKIEVLESTYKKSIPFFNERTTYWSFYSDSDDAAKMKLGMYPSSSEWGYKKPVSANNMDMHTINYLLNGEEKPGLHTYNKQPCVSCDENYNKILSSALAWIARRNGTCEYINISQNDGGGGWCECELCTNYNNLYGNGHPTGSWWYFINRIATDIHEIYPDVEIRTYAYEDTSVLPNLDIVDGVSAYVSSGNGRECAIHGLDDPCCEFNKAIGTADTIKVWSDKIDVIYIYEYLGCPSEFNMTYPNLYAMRDDYRLYAESEAVGVIPFGTATVSADFVALRYYLMTYLTWDPYVDISTYNKLISDFCEHYYGKESGKYICDFIKLTMDTFENQQIKVVYAYRIAKTYVLDRRATFIIPEDIADHLSDESFDWKSLISVRNVLESDFLDEGDRLFELAENAAENDTQLARIKLAHLQIPYYELHLFDSSGNYLLSWVSLANKAVGKKVFTNNLITQRYRKMNEELWLAMREAGITQVAEGADVPNEPNLANNPADWED